jgi:hypothetical protein
MSNDEYSFKMTCINQEDDDRSNSYHKTIDESTSSPKNSSEAKTPSVLEKFRSSNLIKVKFNKQQKSLAVKKEKTEPVIPDESFIVSRQVLNHSMITKFEMKDHSSSSSMMKNVFYQFSNEISEKKQPNKRYKIYAINKGLVCPFCFFYNLNSVECLLKHFKASHFRFNFNKTQPTSFQAANIGYNKEKFLIDVSLDDLFDGSHLGKIYFGLCLLILSKFLKNCKSF